MKKKFRKIKKDISSDHLRSFYLSSDPLPRSSSEPIPDLSTSREHILHIYDNIISKISPAKRNLDKGFRFQKIRFSLKSLLVIQNMNINLVTVLKVFIIFSSHPL